MTKKPSNSIHSLASKIVSGNRRRMRDQVAVTSVFRAASNNIVDDLLDNYANVIGHLRVIPKFSVDDNIYSSVKDMMRSDTQKLLTGFKYARPPFDKMWIETGHIASSDGHLVRVGYYISYGVDRLGERIGVLQFNEVDNKLMPASLYPSFIRPDRIDSNIGAIEKLTGITFDEARAELIKIVATDKSNNGEVNLAEHMKSLSVQKLKPLSSAEIVLRILLLMNSRSQIFAHEPYPKFEEVCADNLRRKRVGAKPNYPVVPIRFNIERAMKKYGVSREDAESICREHLVRGHFKLRTRGVFWWSPHLRNTKNRDGEAMHPPEYRVVKSGKSPQFVPSFRLGDNSN